MKYLIISHVKELLKTTHQGPSEYQVTSLLRYTFFFESAGQEPDRGPQPTCAANVCGSCNERKESGRDPAISSSSFSVFEVWFRGLSTFQGSILNMI